MFQIICLTLLIASAFAGHGLPTINKYVNGHSYISSAASAGGLYTSGIGAPALISSGYSTAAAPALISSGYSTAAAPALINGGYSTAAAPALISSGYSTAAAPALVSSSLPVSTDNFIGAAPAFSAGIGALGSGLSGYNGYAAPVYSQPIYSAGLPVGGIYADNSHIHPGRELIYKVQTPPKVHRQVALVGRVVQQPKINVVEVLKSPDINKVSVIEKPKQKIVQTFPTAVTTSTRVLKAPEQNYVTKNWFASKQRETVGNIVTTENGKIGDAASYGDLNGATHLASLPAEWQVFANNEWNLGPAGDQALNAAVNHFGGPVASSYAANAAPAIYTTGAAPAIYTTGAAPAVYTTGAAPAIYTTNAIPSTTFSFGNSATALNPDHTAALNAATNAAALNTATGAQGTGTIDLGNGATGLQTVTRGADGSTTTTTTYKTASNSLPAAEQFLKEEIQIKADLKKK